MILSAINNKDNNKIKTDRILEPAKEEAFVPQQDPSAGTTDDNQNKSTPPKLNLQTIHGSKETTCILTNENDPLRNQIRSLSVNNTEPLQKSCVAVTKSDAFLSVTDGPEQVKEEISQMEPKNMQETANNGPDTPRCSQRAELCVAGLTVVTSTAPCEKKPELRATLVSAESAEAGWEIYCLKSASQSSHVADALPETPSVCVNTEPEKLKATSVGSPCKDKTSNHELMLSDAMNSSDLCGGAERRPTGARAEETTVLHVKQEAMTDICHPEEQTTSSALCTAVRSEMQIPAVAVADAARGTRTCDLVMAERQNIEESTQPERLESESSEVPERQDRATLAEVEAALKVAAFC